MFRVETHDFSEAGHHHCDCFFDETPKGQDEMFTYVNETISNYYLNENKYSLIDFNVNFDEYGNPVLRLVFKRPSKCAMLVDDTAELFIGKITTNKEYCYEC